MGSPLGGVYLNRLNRMQAEKFAVESRIELMVNIALCLDDVSIMDGCLKTYIGEKSTLQHGLTTVEVTSCLLPSGLLKVMLDICYRDKVASHNQFARQEINLEYAEKVTTYIAADKKLMLTLQCLNPTSDSVA